MSTGWTTVLALAIGCYALKSAAPMVLGGRNLPGWLDTLAQRLPAPLLAALTVVAAVASGRSIHPDARLIGLAAAALALWRRANFVVVVVVAAIATAVARAIGG
jgi:branched-subunit amino acid transport protein AzlD